VTIAEMAVLISQQEAKEVSSLIRVGKNEGASRKDTEHKGERQLF